MAYYYQLFNWFSEIPAANTKSPSAAAAEKEAHRSLVSGSFQTVNIAGEGNCTFSRILEIVLFFFAVRQKADRAAGRGRGCFFAARVVG